MQWKYSNTLKNPIAENAARKHVLPLSARCISLEKRFECVLGLIGKSSNFTQVLKTDYPEHTWHNLNQFEGLNILNIAQLSITIMVKTK